MALADFQSLTRALVRDAGEIDAAGCDQAITLAVARYSTDRPRQAVAAATLPGGATLAPPPDWPSADWPSADWPSADWPSADWPSADWDDGISRLVGVEVGDGDGDARRPVGAALDLGPQGWRIRLAEALPAGTRVLIRYETVHAVDEATDSIPWADREAVCCWAASVLLEQRASYHAGDREPALTTGDHVDFQGQSGRLAARAKRMRQTYYDHLGIAAKRAIPAAATVDFDRRDSRGRDRLFHGQGRR